MVDKNDAAITTKGRAPKSRTTFQPLEPQYLAMIREKNRAALSRDPRRAELERRLLDLGGAMAILFMPDCYMGKLMDRGRDFPGTRALMRRGQPNACHANAGMLFVESHGDTRIATGYTLSPDGLWRHHSWGIVAKNGRVVETTVRRVRYHGFVLDDAEAMAFLAMNVMEGNYSDAELDSVFTFLSGFFDEATVEQVRHEMMRCLERIAHEFVGRIDSEVLQRGDRQHQQLCQPPCL
jgi:hypothetical protein